MKIKFTKAPTFTKAIIASAVFAIAYLASTSNLPSCSDTVAILSSGGECIERQSFLHTASGWLALICLVAAVLLLALKHKDSILGRQASVQQARQGPVRHRHRYRHRCQGGLRTSAPSAAPASSRETGSARDAESQWGPCNPDRNTGAHRSNCRKKRSLSRPDWLG